MTSILRAIQNWFSNLAASWNKFWFTPLEPHTLAMLRIFGGAMLFYTHLVWSLDLDAFLGKDSWITADVSRAMHRDGWVWSYWWYIDSPGWIWTVHILGLVVFAMLTVGLYTRVVSVLACIVTLSYCHRLNGALFGLDQVNAMLAMYLMIGDAGGVYSLDHWRNKGRGGGPVPTVGTNIAIRLIQLQLCVVYLFGGIGKMRGEMWWDGSALWYSIANYEYQSLNLIWLGRWPLLIAALTHLTVLWETFYWVLVWNRITRPIALLLAVLVHGGIALGLGMFTFGAAMLIANGAFLSPQFVARIVDRITKKSPMPERAAGQGGDRAPAKKKLLAVGTQPPGGPKARHEPSARR